MIRGERIYLSALDPSNAEIALGWFADPEVREWLLNGHIPMTLASEHAFYARMEASDSDYVFEIHLAENDRYIGNAGINGVKLPERDGEIGILIGEKDCWNQGYGRDALLTLMRFGFETLGMHRLQIQAVEGHERAVHLYPSLGFTETGRRREAQFLHGRFWDDIMWDMLESEWRALGHSGRG
jgi:RimJ/RimL family protein N-acetyltransferase